jgi:hypothetical protein
MSVNDIRFRNEGALVVLEVYRPGNQSGYFDERQGKWEDAKTSDLLEVAKLIEPASRQRLDLLERQVETLQQQGDDLSMAEQYRRMTKEMGNG